MVRPRHDPARRSGEVCVYRTQSGGGAVAPAVEDGDADPRDYDVDHYARVLRDTYAARLARALTPSDFAAVFADPDQLSLFAPPMDGIRPVLLPTGEMPGTDGDSG